MPCTRCGTENVSLGRVCPSCGRVLLEAAGLERIRAQLARWQERLLDLTRANPLLGESVSPLWLVPCTLENFGPSAAMRLSRADEEVQLNPALALYLRERQHVRLPEAPEEPTAESLATVLEEVRDAVREQGWKVENDMWLSTYSFESLVLYKDLRALESVALGNPIV